MDWFRRHFKAVTLVVFAALLLTPAAIRFYGEYLWFQSLQFGSVFVRILSYKTGLFLATTLLVGLVLYGSHRWAVENIQQAGTYTPRSWTMYILLGVAALLGFSATGAWDTVLQYLHATPFPVSDPVFQENIGFHVFTLPFARTVLTYSLITVAAAVLAAFTTYLFQFGVDTRGGPQPPGQQPAATRQNPPVKTASINWADFRDRVYTYASTHLGLLLTLFFLLLAAYFSIARYDLLLGGMGAVSGAGFTDIHVRIPVLTGLAVISALTGATVFLNMFQRREKLLYIGAGLLAVAYLFGMGGAALTQSFIVEPDELNKEKPFIQHEINYTRQAYDLNQITAEKYEVSPDLTREELRDHKPTLRNTRLWDWRPLMKTYNELQIFRTYYTFPDIDVDRYTVNGKQTAVMLGAREMNTDELPERSKTWVNKHLVYTHGFGMAMSPVRNVTAEGLPQFYIRDIPPNISADGLTLDQPRIYYGEETDTYAVVNTDTEELDYPAGQNNRYTSYDGGGGVEIGSAFTKAVYATMFSSTKFFFSDSIQPGSKVMFHRNIKDRVNTLAPFLKFDSDPYVVAADGSLYYIIDGYTTTGNYPYAKQTRFKNEGTRYVRNSVKTVVNAYTGDVTFYVAENEPVIETYRSMFPALFEDLADMPAALKDHIRYPEDLFTKQMDLYRTYHMENPQVFYNKEDVWRMPQEITRGREELMEPYYIMMQFPGNREAEFVQIMPFIPKGRENMIGWVAARSDPPRYGEITAFQLTKQKLVFGPMQVESRIDQDTAISQRITLWSKSGSDVFRGNLLAIPLADSMLYVEPLYLQSRESGSLPQVKRVIVAQGDQLAMEPTLSEALNSLYNKTLAPRPASRTEAPRQELTGDTLRQAQTLYQEAQAALRRGDFTVYSQKITALGELLNDTE